MGWKRVLEVPLLFLIVGGGIPVRDNLRLRCARSDSTHPPSSEPTVKRKNASSVCSRRPNLVKHDPHIYQLAFGMFICASRCSERLAHLSCLQSAYDVTNESTSHSGSSSGGLLVYRPILLDELLHGYAHNEPVGRTVNCAHWFMFWSQCP